MDHILVQRGLRLVVDHRADVGGGIGRIADGTHVHRAVEPLDQPVGGVVRQEQQAQRRAALAGRAEGREDHVVDHLLALGRGVDEHGVEPAGLGDEGHDRALARRQGAVDRPGGVGAAGEGDAGQHGMGEQRRADGLASPRQEVQDSRGSPAGVEQPHRLGGDQRRLLGRLGQHRVAGRQRRGDLAGEDGERKVPRADAGEDAAAVQLQRVGLADRAFQSLGAANWRSARSA